jgi:hypothetical protein
MNEIINSLINEQFGTKTGTEKYFVLTRDRPNWEGYDPDNAGYVITRFSGNSIESVKTCVRNCRYENLGTFESLKAAKEYMSNYPYIPLRII